MTRGSPLRSMGVNAMPRKSHSIEAPRSTIASQLASTWYESEWPMTTRAGSAPASSKMSSCRSPTGDMTACVVTAIPVARAARPQARRTRSSWADTHGLWTPISPMIPVWVSGAVGAFAARDAVLELPNHHVRQLAGAAPVNQRLGRIVRFAVPAGPHDEMEAGSPSDGAQPRRITADPWAA